MKKRWIAVLMLVISAVLIGGCSRNMENGTENSTENSAENSGQEHRGQALVTLGEYKGLTITAQRAEYVDEDYEIGTKQMYLYYIQDENGRMDVQAEGQITDRPVENLDLVNIDYTGKKDGVAFEGGTAQGAALLIGSGQFIAGFEEGLIGVMPGETVDLNLTFPEYYQPQELAGQEVVFTVTVNYILNMEDVRVEEIGIPDVTTVDELRAYVREGMDAQAQDEYMTAAQDELLTQLLENAVFGELPEDMVAENREAYALWLDQNAAASFGMTGKDYLTMIGMDYETTLNEYAEQSTREGLLLQAIADNEGLGISDAALEERLENYARQTGGTVDALFENGLTKEDYREAFLYEDVYNFLLDNSVSVKTTVD